jgi:formiminoglutamase
MNEIFETATRPQRDLSFKPKDPNDVRLSSVILTEEKDYEASNIVIIGCPTDAGEAGTELAPDAVREEFYKLSPFGITWKVFDFGNTKTGASLEETHEAHYRLVTQFLRDGKKVISLGGGNDISYPHGCAMAEVFGAENWIAIHIDAHFDVAVDSARTNRTQFRQLLEEKFLRPDYFYQIAYQPHYASPFYYRFLQDLGVKLVSLDQLRARETPDAEIRELVRQEFVHHSASLSTFFSFDLSAIRSSDAPGVSASSPIGLRAGEFLTLVQFAAKLVNTKIIEFSEINPNHDVDKRTVQLIAVAMHRFCSSQPRI